MPTPDRFPGVRQDEGLQLSDESTLATAAGEVRYTSGRFSFYDSLGEYDPRSGSGISAAQHKALRDLIHFIDDGPADGFPSGAVRDTTYSGAFPAVVDWWEDATKTQRIVDLTITYTGAFPTTEQWRMYDTDGVTVLVTLTDAITYSGAFETTRTRTWV